MYIWAAFDNWLTFTINWKMAVMTIISSKLPNSSNNGHIFTAAYKNTALNRSSKDYTILTVINVDICSNIKNKIAWIFTILNVKLLTFDRIWDFYLELLWLIFEIVVLWIKFFLLYFWWQDIVLRLSLLLYFRRLNNRFWLRLCFLLFRL